MAMRLNLTTGKGETFNRHFQYLDADDNPIDLTDSVIVFRVVQRNSGTIVGDFLADADSQGNISVYIHKNTTATFPGRLSYRIVREQSDDDKWIVYGGLTVIDGDVA